MVFGVTLRGAATLALGAIFTIINDEIMGFVIPFMGHPDHWLVEGFQAVVKWDATVLVLAVAVMLITNGIVRGGESNRF